jgi:Cys-tRNA(Pro)/Cys-tRNA(Cys) deacylase
MSPRAHALRRADRPGKPGYFSSSIPAALPFPAEALRQVGLDPDLPRTLGQYSQGMRQRTSLARVLLPVPELLLLDEPFSNMDVESVSQMVELLAGFRQGNRTIVITTHQREHAAPIADWVLALKRRPRRVVRTEEPNLMKTNGARFLESLGIPFELREYEVDPDDLSAITVAKKIGMPAEQVFKTLLVTGGPDIYRFAVIPGDAELDFKKLARAAGLRKAEMAPLKDVQPLTGYIRGGVTLFGARKPYPVYIDETAILFDQISVSAGARGTQLILSAQRLPPRRASSRSRSPARRPDQRPAPIDLALQEGQA